MEILDYGSATADTVLLQPVDKHDLSMIENEIEMIRSRTNAEFRLLAFKVGDWNRDLSPWKAPAVFGREEFGGGAADTLAELMRCCDDSSKRYFIGGYSLAGLFALWSAYQTDRFRAVAAASPSLWFPGFSEYMNENEIRCRHVYLSLGDREEKTRNRVMATVGERIREACILLKNRKVDCILEWNPGNHFTDADLRTAKAFAWTINHQS